MPKKSQKAQKEKMSRVVACLEELYPESQCALEHGGEPWKLLVMGRLSAQCTDARVNIVCKECYKAKHPHAHLLRPNDVYTDAVVLHYPAVAYSIFIH